MDAFLEQRRRASAAMGPLQSLQDVAIFADAQLQCPQGLAGRADRLAELMRSGGVVCNEKEAASLLQRAAGRWLALLRRVRAGPVVAVQTVSACIACGHTSFAAARRDRCCRPWFYSDDGAVQGEMHYARCNQCQARHYVSYATGGTVLGDKQLFFPGVNSRDWFHLTEHTAFHPRLLQRLTAQMVHSHTGWSTFTQVLDPDRLHDESRFLYVMLCLMKLRNRFLREHPAHRVCPCCG